MEFKWVALTVTTIGVLMVGIDTRIVIIGLPLTAPYNLITQIISSVNPAAIPAAGRALFVASLKNTYLAFAIINAVAIIPAVIGGRTKKNRKHRRTNNRS